MDTAHGDGHGPSGNGGTARRAEAQSQPRMWLQPFLLLALDRGSVYRILRQLEKDGLVSSGWDTSKEGPARRLYSLTDAGRAYLGVWAASLRAYQAMLDQFFSLYPPPPVPSGSPSGDQADGSDGR